MHGATLVFSFWTDFGYDIAHSEASIPNHKLCTVKSAFFQPYQDAFLAFDILLYALGSADDLTVTVRLYTDGNKNTGIFKFSSPVTLEVNTLYIHIRVLPRLFSITPFLNMYVGFVIEIADGRHRHIASPTGIPICFPRGAPKHLQDTSQSAPLPPSSLGDDNAR